MQKVRGHLHSDSTPSWPTDHVARKGREMRHRCAPVLHAPRGINAGRGRNIDIDEFGEALREGPMAHV